MSVSSKLDRQVLIEKKSSSQESGYGTEVVAWLPLSTVAAAAEWYWAEVSDFSPSRNEAMVQGVPFGRTLTRVRIRYREDIDSSMRVTVRDDTGNRVMQIVGGPSHVGGRKQLTELICEKLSS